MEHHRDSLGILALTIVGLSLTQVAAQKHFLVSWCYSWTRSPNLFCPEPGVMRLKSVLLGDQDRCSLGLCCPYSVYCERPAGEYDADLFTLITEQCEGEPYCQIAVLYSRPNALYIDCGTEGAEDWHEVDYVKVYYTCENRREAKTTQPSPIPGPSATYFTPTAIYTPTSSTPTTQTTDAPTTTSVAPSVAGDRQTMAANVNKDVMIAVVATVACLILLTIILVVVCVKRRKREQKPAPSPGFTGHRDTATENVYTVSGGDDYEIVQLPLTTIHPELPNPDPGVSAPGPCSSSRDPESSHRKLDRAPEALAGGASGGQTREPEVYAVVRRDRQEDDELDMKENEAYGHL